uniref:Protein kinase domain-containing protein n=1 Tax=Oryza glumipatula TaxID=40148 RepID=A0A0D9ZJJ5_9ORYZ
MIQALIFPTLLCLTIATSGGLAVVAASTCQRSCGSIDIPFPFGIKGQAGCAMPGFELICNSTGNSIPKLLLRNVELLNISLPEGQARMRMPMSYECYNKTKHDMDCVDKANLSLTGSPFTFSNSANKFTVFGCRMLGYLGPGGQSAVGSNLTIGCATSCGQGDDLVSINGGGCSGIGCCQTAIPEGIKHYKVWFDTHFNTSVIHNWSRCSYGALVEEASFKFSTIYATSSNFSNPFGGEPPFVVDWVVANNTCAEARKHLDSYACASSNSVCIDSSNGPGYFCKCSQGFEGNPYLQGHDGCQDINECEDSNKYPCYGKCINKLGGFDCFCPAGTRGDASVGPCRKEFPLAFGIAIGLGVGFGILLLVLTVAFLVRKRKNDIQKQLRKKYFRKNQGLLLEQLISSDECATDSTKIFTLEELKEATNNFDPARVLGSGGHGMVYKGILSDQRVVAIKKPNIIREEEICQFINEVAILSQINHRNIVKLFGCCLETEVPLLVYDFVPNGSLNRIIHADPSTREFTLSWDQCLRIATEAAGALYYLHSAASVSVLHRDVKSSNILLDANYTAKVSDFGASRLIPNDQTHVFTNIQGTFGYLDPEYYHTGHLNEKSDVYSFGVVLLELLLRKQPIFDSESGSKKNLSIYFLSELKGRPVAEIAAPDVLEEATEDEINIVASIARACLRLRGEERPTMKQVEMSLQSIRNKGFRSGTVSPEDSDELQTPQSEGHVDYHQAMGIGINSMANLASPGCYSLQEEFMLSGSLPR